MLKLHTRQLVNHGRKRKFLLHSCVRYIAQMCDALCINERDHSDSSVQFAKFTPATTQSFAFAEQLDKKATTTSGTPPAKSEGRTTPVT